MYIRCSVDEDSGQFPGRYVCQKLKKLCDTDGYRVREREVLREMESSPIN